MAFKWVLINSRLVHISVGWLVKANTLIPDGKMEKNAHETVLVCNLRGLKKTEDFTASSRTALIIVLLVFLCQRSNLTTLSLTYTLTHTHTHTINSGMVHCSRRKASVKSLMSSSHPQHLFYRSRGALISQESLSL